MPLTKKQRLILDAILFLLRKGELPTVREVGAIAGLRSPATVLKHLRALEAEKLISMSGKSRGIRITDPRLLDGQNVETLVGRGAGTGAEAGTGFETEAGAGVSAGFHVLQAHARTPIDRRTVGIPVSGAIAAGQPLENPADAFTLDDLSGAVGTQQPSLAIDPRMFASSGDLVALRVEGDSMIDAGILNGDYVIIRRQESVEEGEIAAVLIDGEGTLKRWHYSSKNAPREPSKDTPARSRRSKGLSSKNTDSKNTDSKNVYSTSRSDPSTNRSGNVYPQEPLVDARREETVRLVAANEYFSPIEITDSDRKEVIVFGKYVGLVRGELDLF